MISFDVQLSVTENGRRRPEYTLDSDLNGEISLQDLLKWTKSALIITADEVLREAQGRGFDKQPVVIVDGAKNKAVTEVSPLGQIEFVSRQNFTDVLLETYQNILDLSKVKTGRYKSSHYVFLNGTQVATDLGSLQNWLAKDVEIKDNDLLRIVNIQPYARKLELMGVTAGRTLTRKVDKGRRKGIKTGILIKKPNGVYQLASRRALRKYKNNVSIFFKFIPGAMMGLTAYFKKGRPGKNSAGRTYLYPSLVFKINQGGIL